MIYAHYLPLAPSEDQYDRYCLWQAKQWLAGRLESHEEYGTHGIPVFASRHPFPSSALTAQQVA